MKTLTILALLVSSCATSQIHPKGMCLSKVLSEQQGLVHQGLLMDKTQAECVEDMQKYCASVARREGAVVCMQLWKINTSVSDYEPQEDTKLSDAEPHEDGDISPGPSYDDV